jgi:sporulation protein YlmC with PRC-barrel domain
MMEDTLSRVYPSRKTGVERLSFVKGGPEEETFMSHQPFDLGKKVRFGDGKEGRLVRVVVDPHTQRVVDLIVQFGVLVKHSWIIPTDQVLSVNADVILLSLLSTELPSYPEFSEVDYDTAADEEVMVTPEIENVRYWTGYYSAFVEQPVVPRLHHHVPVGIPSNMESIRRRMPVHNRRGQVGHVDHLLVETQSWTITHLVVRRGLFPYDLIIPMDWVEAVEDVIYIKGDNDQLRLLPLYRPRPMPEVLEELQYRFEVAQPDFSGSRDRRPAARGDLGGERVGS